MNNNQATQVPYKRGTLCTIREDRNGYVPEEDRGYWVVLAVGDSARMLAKDVDPKEWFFVIRHWVKAYSLTHQQHCWRHPNDLIPVTSMQEKEEKGQRT